MHSKCKVCCASLNRVRLVFYKVCIVCCKTVATLQEELCSDPVEDQLTVFPMISSCQILISVERRLAVEYMMYCFFYSMAHFLYREHRVVNIFCGQYLLNKKGKWVSLYPFTVKEIKCRTLMKRCFLFIFQTKCLPIVCFVPPFLRVVII